jgi:hypothetical protein
MGAGLAQGGHHLREKRFSTAYFFYIPSQSELIDNSFLPHNMNEGSPYQGLYGRVILKVG